MQWFTNWWEGLTLLQQILASVAIPATLILIIQTIMLIVGLGGHESEFDNGEADHDFSTDADSDGDIDTDADTDVDMDAEIDEAEIDMSETPEAESHFEVGDRNDVNTSSHGSGSHHAAGLRLFTIRGIVAFLAVGGWLGIAMVDSGMNIVPSILISFAGGFIALLFCALVIKLSLKLQENGTISVRNAIAHMGEVYIPIPPNRSGIGKITMLLQDRFVELEAVTDHDEKLKTGTSVQVVSVTDKNIVVVRPVIDR